MIFHYFCHFFRIPVRQDFNAKRNTDDISMESFLGVEILGLGHRWRIDSCIFREKIFATSWKFNIICLFWQYRSVKIPDRHVPADIFSEKKYFLSGETRIAQKNERNFRLLSFIDELFNSLINFFSAFLQNGEFFLLFFSKNGRENIDVFQLRRKMYNFWEKKNPLIKKHWSLSKNTCFLLLKIKKASTSFWN